MESMTPRNVPHFLFSLTLFLSAALLFSVQPLLGKLMLPLVGGSPSGWLTALAFFQLALLAGYLLAHGLSRLSARNQMIATAALLLAGAIMLPPHFSSAHDIEVSSVGGVLWLLFRTIFLPYVALATVSSGLQRLYAARHCHTGASDPYFLYAASNAGSFVGLLSYPLLVEPFLPLSTQSWLWAVGYALLVLLIITLTAPKSEPISPQQPSPISTPSLSWRRRLHWVILAFIPSSLSMGLTALVTADLGSFPLLWVIPLALYLLTFVIAFARKQNISLDKLAGAQVFFFVPLLIFFIGNQGAYARSWVYTLLPLAVFFVTTLWCHVRLANLRPSAQQLTGYYLWMSLGGALGGCFNAFLAPHLFSYPIEFIIVAALAFFLHQQRHADRSLKWLGYGLAIAMALNSLWFLNLSLHNQNNPLALILIILLPVLLAMFRRSLAVAALAVTLLMQTPLVSYGRLSLERNFFGIVEVVERTNTAGDRWRFYVNGAGVHGAQLMTADLSKERKITYLTPLQKLSAVSDFRDVGILGAGPAMALCLGGQQQRSTIYEIDPLAKKTAETWFTYTRDCGHTPIWRMGDGRLELARDTDARFDLLIVDAFNAGSIPTHLLTKEALSVYLSRLKSNGLIAFNTNNLYYDLNDPLHALAQHYKLQAWRYNMNVDIDLLYGKAMSNWVLFAPADRNMDHLKEMGWHLMEPPTDFPVWRDDLSNVLAALKWLRPQKP